MYRKSIIVLLLCGLLLSSCQRETPSPGTDSEPTELAYEPSPLPDFTDEPPASGGEPGETAQPGAAPEATATQTQFPATPVTELATPTGVLLFTPTVTSTLVLSGTLFARQPFAGWSEEYQVVQVPDKLQDLLQAGKARLVPLPADKSDDTEEIKRVVNDDLFLRPFAFDRLVKFEDQSTFAAVPVRSIPTRPDFKVQGLKVGLLYDQSAFYTTRRQSVFEVYFFDTKAEVRRPNSRLAAKTFKVGEDYFWVESESNSEALAFFIKNGCWICWNAGGRTGCLICF